MLSYDLYCPIKSVYLALFAYILVTRRHLLDSYLPNHQSDYYMVVLALLYTSRGLFQLPIAT